MPKAMLLTIPMTFEEACLLINQGAFWLNGYHERKRLGMQAHLEDCHAYILADVIHKLQRLKWSSKPKKVKLYQVQIDIVHQRLGLLGNHALVR